LRPVEIFFNGASGDAAAFGDLSGGLLMLKAES
jgi:hypothetical protein